MAGKAAGEEKAYVEVEQVEEQEEKVEQAVRTEEEAQGANTNADDVAEKEEPLAANKGKGRETSEEEDNEHQPNETPENADGDAPAVPLPTNPWQAILSAEHGAYYFYNTVTNETTWFNPFLPESPPEPATAATTDPDPSSSTSTTEVTNSALAHHAALQAAALAQGIDPALAYLDPSLVSSFPGASSASMSTLPTYTASFNARTGAFARPDARTPGHLSEFERAKRMSEFYFDVGKWEAELAQRGGSNMGTADEGEESGKKRKRPTKKDVEKFKEQKRLKKIAKTAWLRT